MTAASVSISSVALERCLESRGAWAGGPRSLGLRDTADMPLCRAASCKDIQYS